MVMNQRQSYLIDGKKSGAIESPDKTLLELFNHGISNVQSKNILSNFIK